MPTAETDHTITRQRKSLPLGDALQPTIARLKAIAAASVDSLITEGPVHPDHALLDLCGEALHLLKQSKELSDARERPLTAEPGRAWTEADRTRDRELFDESQAKNHTAAKLLRRARNLRATTAAGVYAKALIVRGSRTGAQELAMSLADDLIACPGLRQSLWPVAIGGEG